jgi:hypothetical protein
MKHSIFIIFLAIISCSQKINYELMKPDVNNLTSQSNYELYKINKQYLQEIVDQKEFTLIFFNNIFCYDFELHHKLIDAFSDNENLQIIFVSTLDAEYSIEYKEFLNKEKFDKKFFFVEDTEILKIKSWNLNKEFRLRLRKFFVDVWGDSTELMIRYPYPEFAPQIVLTNDSLDLLFEESVVIPEEGFTYKLKQLIDEIGKQIN